jgi:glycosyltransferase involved in cell wall biosynthesis
MQKRGNIKKSSKFKVQSSKLRVNRFLKILFVNNFRGRGGGEEFLRDLLPGLAAKGVKVGLICRPDTPLVDMFRNSEVTLHPIPRSGLSTISAVFKTAKVIREGGYDIIDIQRGHDIIQSWLGAKLSDRNPALMYTPQVPEFIRSRFLLSRMKKIVTISRHIRDRIVSYSPKLAPRTSIIYYGIDLDKFKPENIRRGTLKGRFGLSSDARIIGTVGDLWKNQVAFLDALVLIRKEIPGARFALVGSDNGTGPVEAFKRRAEELGLTEAILWTGRLSKEDMLSFYADIDLAVSTHRNEGFGIWVLEALAVGTPVVSVNEGGIRDSLEGCPAGLLVDGGPDEMARGVIRILKDPSLRTRMKEAGPKWTTEHYGRKRMVDDYFRFFKSL